MIVLAIDAVVLMFLLKMMNDEDIGFLGAALVAFCASLGTGALAVALVLAIGLPGLFVAALVAAGVLGAVVSALYGVEIKRSMLIAVIFMVVHVAVSLAINALLRG